jgi:hypothetical protein
MTTWIVEIITCVANAESWSRNRSTPSVRLSVRQAATLRGLVTNEDRFCVQYLIPKKLSGLTRELTEKLYETFSDDLIAKDVSEFRQEIDRWVVKWDIASDPKPSNLSETLRATSYDLYPNIYPVYISCHFDYHASHNGYC